MTDALLETIANYRLFDGFPAESIEEIASFSEYQDYKRGDIIFWQDKPCHHLYIVETGQVRIYKTAPNGKEHILFLASGGNGFAEIAAIDGLPFPSNAACLEKTKLIAVDALSLRQLLDEQPRLARIMLTSLASWTRYMVNQIEDIVLRDAIGRFANYIMKLCDRNGDTTAFVFKHSQVALHLNITPETLSRCLRRLQEQQVILVNNKKLTLLDRERLNEHMSLLT